VPCGERGARDRCSCRANAPNCRVETTTWKRCPGCRIHAGHCLPALSRSASEPL
jgi:hypothetical protein